MRNCNGVEFPGMVFIRLTYQWPDIPNIADGYEGTCWVSLKDILFIRPTADGRSYMTLTGGETYNIKETPDEIMERIHEWNIQRN